MPRFNFEEADYVFLNYVSSPSIFNVSDILKLFHYLLSQNCFIICHVLEIKEKKILALMKVTDVFNTSHIYKREF